MPVNPLLLLPSALQGRKGFYCRPSSPDSLPADADADADAPQIPEYFFALFLVCAPR